MEGLVMASFLAIFKWVILESKLSVTYYVLIYQGVLNFVLCVYIDCKKVSGANLVAWSKSLCLDDTLRPLASRTTGIYKNPSSLISTLTQLSY